MTRGKGLQVFIAIGMCLAGGGVFGEQAQQAKVTQVINDVKLVPSQAAPRPATVNDLVKQGTAVRTGADSRTELTFADLTITRLGANTVFSFKPATRDLNLLSGAVLIQVPPGAPEVRVLSSAVSAAISGGTAIFDATTGKFMVLEGVGRVWPTGHPELAVTVHAGEMVWLTPDGHISQPEPFDVNLVMETSLLIIDFARLPNYDLIAQVIDEQQLNAGRTSSSPPFTSNEDIISQRFATSPTPSATATPIPTPTPTPSPSGTPSKFGSPQTITSPNPYVIDATTRITTDPSITTNGQTDFGTIYRGPSMDGPFSNFVFGSTSNFDTSSGFDAQITGSGAGFKFTALALTGNPTVDTTNGETSLGLIGVNAITSGAPGGALTFTGIKGFLLATVNGPITLGPEVSFSGMNDFTAYARGAVSDLTLGSNVNATSNLRLYGQRDINVTSSVRAPLLTFVAGRDLNFSTLASSETITGDFGNVSLQAGNNITSQQQIQLERLNASGSSQFNLTLNAGNDLTVGTNLLLSIANSEATFGGSANIVVGAGGTLTTGGMLDATINNSNGGNLGTNALIQVAASGMTSGGDLNLTIHNSNGSIDGNTAINLNIAGDLIIQGAANLFITNSPLGHIVGDATINTLAPAGINAGNGAFFAIVNEDSGSGTFGGTIDGNAGVHVTADHLSTEALVNSAFNLFGTIHNSGGRIGGNCNVMFDISGAITTAGEASFDILNFDHGGANGGGMIGGDATVNVNAGALSIGGGLLVKIINNGGVIKGNANINMNVGTTATVANDANIQILGDDPAGSAAINFNGGSYDVGGTFLSTIDGNGRITFSNADVRADVIKVGTFGDNGVLRIGGGSLNANTMLKLYAPGSNGMINFVANVTLSSDEVAPIIAAKTVTIANGVTVTILGLAGPASVFTDTPNYSVASGGNGSTTGIFSGNGAASPAPLASAPPFDDTSAQSSTGSADGKVPSVKRLAGPGKRPQDGNARRKFITAAGHENIRPGARDGGAEQRDQVRVADTNQLIELMDNPAALAMIDAPKRPSETKRGSLDSREKHSPRSARGSPPRPNQLRGPPGQSARP